MKKIIYQILLFPFIFLFLFVFVSVVFAHGSEPRLEISAERLNPGAPLQVRGVDFEYEQEVTVELVDSTTHTFIISLGKVVTDVEGGFTQNIILPADLLEGVYNLRAVTYDHEVFSPPITVSGIAVEDLESNVIQDQSDVQFEPITALPPGPAPTAVSQTTSLVQPVSNRNRNLIIVFILLGIGILVLFGSRIKQK